MFIVIETQTDADGVVGTLVNAYPTQAEAESKYYSILSAAAISEIYLHGAFLLRADGQSLMSYAYRHIPQEEAIEPVSTTVF